MYHIINKCKQFWILNKILNWIVFFAVRNAFLTWLRVWISKNWNASIVTLFIWSHHPQFSSMCFYRLPVQSRLKLSYICADRNWNWTASQFLNSLIPFPNSSIFPSSGDGIFAPSSFQMKKMYLSMVRHWGEKELIN